MPGYGNTTPRFLIPFPDAGQASSAAEEEKRELAIEHPLELAIYPLTAGLWDGTVWDGFLVSAGAGLSISVAAGRGFVDGLAIYAAAPTTKSGLTNNSTLYIYLKKTSTTQADQAFTVEQSLSGPPMADAILIATVTTSGGAVTAVDNSPASRTPRIRVPGLPRVRVVAPFGAEYSSPKTAIEACNPGDMVWICAGTYALTATITMPADNITVQATNREGCILNNTTGSAQTVINLNGKSGITLRGFTIQTAAGNTGTAIYNNTGTPTDSLVENVSVVSVALAYGVNLTAISRSRILYSRFSGPFSTMAVRLAASPNSRVEGCYVDNSYGGAAAGLQATLGCDSTIISENRVILSGASATGTAIGSWNDDDVTIVGNLVSIPTPAAGAVGIFAIGYNEGANRAAVICANVLISAGGVGVAITFQAQASQYLDYCIAGSNIAVGWATGVSIVNAGCRYTLVHGNNLHGCTAPTSDTGTDTLIADNH
jgi:hypothetical protein